MSIEEKYDSVVDALTRFLDKSYVAKNPDFQQELDKVNALYKRVIPNTIELIKKIKALGGRTESFFNFNDQFSTLNTQVSNNLQSLIKISKFMDLFKTEKNPAAEERQAFWTWSTTLNLENDGNTSRS